MTKKEIELRIGREESRIETLKEMIVNIRSDIKATRKAIRFWKNQRKTAPEK